MAEGRPFAGSNWSRLQSRLERVPTWAWVVVLSGLVLLPLIGTYGLWEPYEFTVADVAREVARTGDYGSILWSRPPLTVWLSAAGIQLFGVSEFAARLPLALMGMAGVLATYGIGCRLRSPRAGLIAAIVLLASPLYVFQCRQLTSDIGTTAAAAIAVYGMLGLAWPRDPARANTPLRLAIDGVLAVLGLGLGFLGAGLLLGVVVPSAAIAVGAGIARAGRFGPTADDGATADVSPPASDPALRLRQLLAAVIGGGVAVVTLGMVLAQLGTKGYVMALGGAWRPGAPPADVTYEWIVDQVGVGMFPWAALAPIAVLRLAVVRKNDRAAWGGIVMLAWAVVAYVASAWFVRRVGDVRFPGMASIAVAVGLMLDDLLVTRERSVAVPAGPAGSTGSALTAATSLPLAALFVLLAAAQLARDNLSFPDQLASVHLLSAAAKYPTTVKLLPIIVMFGVFFGALAAIGLAIRPPAPGSDEGTAVLRRAAGRCVLGAVTLSYLFGLFLSLRYTPALSQHFSYKNLFESYRSHKQGDDKLGVMGIPGSGPDYYAQGAYDKLAGLPGLVTFLQSAERVFAISPASDLCALHQKAGAGQLEYHVIDDENSRFLLFSNRLAAGEKDKNPLLTAIRRTPPEHIGKRVAATYVPSTPGQKGQIELIGVDMPSTVARGKKFKVTLHFHVLENVTTSYKIFMHFDKGSSRFNGDHDPINGRCGTQFWQKDDYISDTFEVTAGEMTSPSGEYDLWAGFFTGGSGSWKNMTVTNGNPDGNNRVKIGSIRVKSGGGGCR